MIVDVVEHECFTVETLHLADDIESGTEFSG